MKLIAATALALAILLVAHPVFAQSNVDALLQKQLDDSYNELMKAHKMWPDLVPAPSKLPPITIPHPHVYKPQDYTQPRPPIGTFNSLNSPSVFGPTRPSCMPYYEGCWRVR